MPWLLTSSHAFSSCLVPSVAMQVIISSLNNGKIPPRHSFYKEQACKKGRRHHADHFCSAESEIKPQHLRNRASHCSSHEPCWPNSKTNFFFSKPTLSNPNWIHTDADATEAGEAEAKSKDTMADKTRVFSYRPHLPNCLSNNVLGLQCLLLDHLPLFPGLHLGLNDWWNSRKLLLLRKWTRWCV